MKWTHYLWTNDKNLIPSTIALFESAGVIVRNIHELNFDERTLEMEAAFYKAEQTGQIADMYRLVILREYGGVYMDVDFKFSEWDLNAHYYLNFFTYANHVMGQFYHLGNDLLHVSPHHPVIEAAYETLLSEYFAEGYDAPL